MVTHTYVSPVPDTNQEIFLTDIPYYAPSIIGIETYPVTTTLGGAVGKDEPITVYNTQPTYNQPSVVYTTQPTNVSLPPDTYTAQPTQESTPEYDVPTYTPDEPILVYSESAPDYGGQNTSNISLGGSPGNYGDTGGYGANTGIGGGYNIDTTGGTKVLLPGEEKEEKKSYTLWIVSAIAIIIIVAAVIFKNK